MEQSNVKQKAQILALKTQVLRVNCLEQSHVARILALEKQVTRLLEKCSDSNSRTSRKRTAPSSNSDDRQQNLQQRSIKKFLSRWMSQYRCAYHYLEQGCKFDDQACRKIHDASSLENIAHECDKIARAKDYRISKKFNTLYQRSRGTSSEHIVDKLIIDLRQTFIH